MPFLCAHCEVDAPLGHRSRSQRSHICSLHSGSVSSDDEELRRPPWAWRQTPAVVAVAVVVGGVGGAAIYAATQGPSHAMAGGMHAPPRGAPPAGPITSPPPAQPQAEPANVLHSEYVVSDGHGGFTTKMTQTGVVDELTLSQIVIRSDDGYTQIYVFPSSAVVPDKSVAAKDTVTVEATRTGSTVTLNRIGEGQPPPGN